MWHLNLCFCEKFPPIRRWSVHLLNFVQTQSTIYIMALWYIYEVPGVLKKLYNKRLYNSKCKGNHCNFPLIFIVCKDNKILCKFIKYIMERIAFIIRHTNACWIIHISVLIIFGFWSYLLHFPYISLIFPFKQACFISTFPTVLQ